MDDLFEVRLVVAELHAGLDTVPYHVYLGVNEDAAGDALRDAFHLRAKVFHPDLFMGSADDDLRARVYDVYKRMTEAYRVLTDPQLRRTYEEQRRNGAVRLEQAKPRPTTPRRPEDAIGNPAARKHFLLGLEAERRADLNGARLHFKLALQLEPDNEVILAKLAPLPG